MKKIYIWSVIFLLLILFVVNPISSNPANDYVGTETCLECHDDMFDTIKKTPHNYLPYTKDISNVESCEACHGPGSIHIEDPEAQGAILSFKNVAAGEAVDACLNCHKEDKRFKHFQRGKHFLTGESCTSCHTLHQSRPSDNLLSREPEKMCFSCHQEQEAAFSLPYHHKVKEGRMTCWNCHDSHNTEVSPQSIGQKKINENCFTCHPSKKGPFTYEHLAVNTGGCSVCHTPHGSENARLLQRSAQYLLCIECHAGPSFSDQLLGPKTPSFHITSKLTYQNCTICHVRIHGSYLEKHFLR